MATAAEVVLGRLKRKLLVQAQEAREEQEQEEKRKIQKQEKEEKFLQQLFAVPSSQWALPVQTDDPVFHEELSKYLLCTPPTRLHATVLLALHVRGQCQGQCASLFPPLARQDPVQATQLCCDFLDVLRTRKGVALDCGAFLRWCLWWSERPSIANADDGTRIPQTDGLPPCAARRNGITHEEFVTWELEAGAVASRYRAQYRIAYLPCRLCAYRHHLPRILHQLLTFRLQHPAYAAQHVLDDLLFACCCLPGKTDMLVTEHVMIETVWSKLPHTVDALTMVAASIPLSTTTLPMGLGFLWYVQMSCPRGVDIPLNAVYLAAASKTPLPPALTAAAIHHHIEHCSTVTSSPWVQAEMAGVIEAESASVARLQALLTSDVPLLVRLLRAGRLPVSPAPSMDDLPPLALSRRNPKANQDDHEQRLQGLMFQFHLHILERVLPTLQPPFSHTEKRFLTRCFLDWYFSPRRPREQIGKSLKFRSELAPVYVYVEEWRQELSDAGF